MRVWEGCPKESKTYFDRMGEPCCPSLSAFDTLLFLSSLRWLLRWPLLTSFDLLWPLLTIVDHCCSLLTFVDLRWPPLTCVDLLWPSFEFLWFRWFSSLRCFLTCHCKLHWPSLPLLSSLRMSSVECTYRHRSAKDDIKQRGEGGVILHNETEIVFVSDRINQINKLYKYIRLMYDINEKHEHTQGLSLKIKLLTIIQAHHSPYVPLTPDHIWPVS